MSRFPIFLWACGFLVGCVGCSSDSVQADPGSGLNASGSPVAEAVSDGSLYLRGEMNDYGVSETYRLRPGKEGLCTQAVLRADWSPYKFKFADSAWTPGHTYGYAEPPGTLREAGAPVKLNPNSRFEELRVHVQHDGIYNFCLLERSGVAYAQISEIKDAKLPGLSEALK